MEITASPNPRPEPSPKAKPGPKSRLNRYAPMAAAALLLLLLAELTLSIHNQSLSWDEGDHLFAGYMSWRTADFGINPEHPPLVKAIAAIPLLSMHLRVPPSKHLPNFKDEAYFDGRDLIFKNGGEPVADKMIFRARMAAASLTILLGVILYLAAQEMFGAAAALFALALIVFEPNMIAHGAYVTTDMGVTCFIFATIYAYYRYGKSPSWQRLLVLGLAAGLALATKHSAVLLLPMGLALALTEILWPPDGAPRKKAALRVAASLAATTVLAILVLWSFYHFRFAIHPGGIPMQPSLAEYASGLHGIEPRIYLAVARLHILPESYLYGLVDVRLVSDFFPSYIFGQVHAHGVWYYFPVAFVIKSTIGFMALLLLAIVAIALGKMRRPPQSAAAPQAATFEFAPYREVLFLTIPPAIYLLVAIGTDLNIGARHILPMYPFLAVLIAGAVTALIKLDRRWIWPAGILLAAHVVSSARAYPVYLAYSNELWGGPAQTYKYLTDSNTDWAQQLRSVKTYIDKRGIKDCWFAYFASPFIDPHDYGIPCRPLPTADTGWAHFQVDSPPAISGPVFISAGTLTGYELGSNILNPYRPYQSLQPTTIIDHGVFVYDKPAAQSQAQNSSGSSSQPAPATPTGEFDNRFASALGHVTRAKALATAHRLPEALTEAETAVAIDPDEFQAQMALADTLTALNRKPEAIPHYQKAQTIAATMEPSAAEEWLQQIKSKLQ